MVLADADKSICHEIIRGRPAIVLFDVVDEHRFDLLRFGGHYLTGSLILGKTGGLDRAIERFGEPTRLRSRDAERMSLFAEAVSTMARTLSAALPETRFILHAARHSSRSVDPDRPLPPNAVERSERANRVLASLESVLAASFPRMRVIQPDPAFRVADPDHKWGLSWCHYIPAYYHDFLDRFERIVMNPPVAAEATA